MAGRTRPEIEFRNYGVNNTRERGYFVNGIIQDNEALSKRSEAE